MCLAEDQGSRLGLSGCRSCGMGICLPSPRAGCSSQQVFRALLALDQCIPEPHTACLRPFTSQNYKNNLTRQVLGPLHPSPSRTGGSFKNHLPGQQGLTFCFAVVCSITRINKHSLALGLPFTFPGLWLCHNLFRRHPRPQERPVSWQSPGTAHAHASSGTAGVKDRGMVSLLLPEMDRGKERSCSVQALLEHIPCRHKWQNSPLWLFLL